MFAQRSSRFFLLIAMIPIFLCCACSDDTSPADPNVTPGPGNGDDPPARTPLLANHLSADELPLLTNAELDRVRLELSFYYGHTSHGSQIMAGLNLLAAQDVKYERPTFHEIGDDLGHTGDVTWAARTRTDLDANPGQWNVVMWSWCGGASDNTVEGINTYLQTMTDLESEYPDILFVYMTGHLDGTGEDGNLRARNNQIRQYCLDNNKILFDFANIESYDPDGTYYPDESDGCSWCSTWCSTHDCSFCNSGCAHSHCFNCYRKGMAFWTLMVDMLAVE